MKLVEFMSTSTPFYILGVLLSIVMFLVKTGQFFTQFVDKMIFVNAKRLFYLRKILYQTAKVSKTIAIIFQQKLFWVETRKEPTIMICQIFF